MRTLLLPILCSCAVFGAESLTAPQLMEMARQDGKSEKFAGVLRASLGETEIAKGTAVLGEGADFIWAVGSEKLPALYVDGQPLGKMQRGAKNLWYYTGKLKTGTSHEFHYIVDGKRFGGRNDVPAYGPDSYERPGVPRGTLSGKLVHTSNMYDGMQSDYWIYVPAQYDPKSPACLMVWHDGQGLVQRDGATRAQIVFDNLTHQKKIPVIIHVFVSPGRIGERPMRSVLYDTVTDKHARFLRDELLPEVYKKYGIRRDGYSRAVAGNSSGGISSFNIAWQQPDQFSRVLSRIGSFTSIQWRFSQPDPSQNLEGGNVYPNKVRKEPKRNLRVWLQDGAEDLENAHGSWPLQNIQMANSLKMRDYDFHFSWGNGAHSGAHGNAELPEELIWLWRDYDSTKTEQIYEQDPVERSKPLFRVTIYNR